MLSMKVGQFPVEAVLVEEREFFLSLAIDDAARAPLIIFAGGGALQSQDDACAAACFRGSVSAIIRLTAC